MVHMRGHVHRPHMAIFILACGGLSGGFGLRHVRLGENPRGNYHGRAVPFGRISIFFPLRLHFEEDRIHERDDVGVDCYWDQIYYLFSYKESVVFFAV